MTNAEITKLVERYIGTTPDGYLCGFSYAKHDSFYSVFCGLDIDVAEARSRFGSTKRTFIGILREANPGDQARIIQGTIEFIPPPEELESDEDEGKALLRQELLEVARRLEATGSVQVTPIRMTSETVYQALQDAELLISQRGPEFAVDRAHTALHGYLKAFCIRKQLVISDTASLTELFGLMRRSLPELQRAVSHDNEAKKLFGSIATCLDCLNTIRNRGTLAHPNELLLEAPDAMLFINISRSVLVYMDAKLGPHK